MLLMPGQSIVYLNKPIRPGLSEAKTMREK